MKPLSLWICLFLFIARVIGQVYVGLYPTAFSFLPPWESWYSGALPYPILLVSQILIIQLMTLMAYDYTRQAGLFFITSLRIQQSIRYFAILYFVSMLIRAAWFNTHHFIPIIFHCVLAIFLFVYSFSGNRKA